MKGCRTRSVQAGIPTQSVGTRTFSFPRRAWECLLGRSASGKCQSSSRLSLLSFSLQDAERPGRHSHAERGNACSDAPRPASVNPPPDYPCCHSRCRTRSVHAGIPTLRVGTIKINFGLRSPRFILDVSSKINLCITMSAERGNDKKNGTRFQFVSFLISCTNLLNSKIRQSAGL
jgi:hypothetical protein